MSEPQAGVAGQRSGTNGSYVSEDVAPAWHLAMVIAVETMMAKDHGKIHIRGTKDWWAMAARTETIRESTEQLPLVKDSQWMIGLTPMLRKELTEYAAQHS